MAAAESEAEAQQLISRLGKQLKASKTCPNKDSLVKLLKEAVIALGKFKQLKSLNSVIQPLSDSLIKHGLLQHKDKDIRILVATCFCEIIRVLAPDPGFSDDVFTDIFKLLQSIFAETGDYKSPYFSRRVKLLETVAKLNVCVLMLDVGCDDLILKMFKIFFSAAREQHPQSVINAMSSIMARILEDKLEEKDLESLIFQEKFSEPLLDVIIQNLLKESKGGSGGFARLAVSVIQNCNEKLERCICTFLRSCILNRESIGSELKEWYHDILYEIFRSAPQMLVSVIPSLSHELLTDQVDVRIKALNLLRKCFSLPGHNIAEEYHNLFMDFLNRFTDKSAEVRLCALSCGKALYTNNPSGTGSSQILTELESRLLDFDDRVRMQAVSIVCDVARLQIGSVTNELISQVADRLRDKKVSVRKKALQKLLELYQDYCTKCVGDIKMHFEQIPCKILMLCYDKDCKEFRPQSLEYVLAEDLFPVSLSVEGRTNHWIFLSSLFTPLHVNALNAILSQKRRLRNALQAYLHLRVHKEEIGSDEMERNTKALFKKMSALFPDPAEAEECFYKLNQVNDNDIFKMLADMINVGDALSTRDNLLRKIGDQSPLFEFLRLLSSKCLLNIFSSRHVSCILDHLTFDKSIRNTKLDYSPLLLLSLHAFQQYENLKEFVSMREYYAYKFQMRKEYNPNILNTGRLLQQFAVDMYVKLETQRLDFYRSKQLLIRREQLQGLMDSVGHGQSQGSKVEIKENMLPTDKAQNRIDLCAKMFHAKLEMLKQELFKKEIFGEVAAYTYVIEFQKHGLPHAHFLIVLKPNSELYSADSYDQIVCAELPDENTQKHLFKMVCRHMMHVPCGSKNLNNVCMQRKRVKFCKNKYPKQWANSTTHGENAYPIYRRKNDAKLNYQSMTFKNDEDIRDVLKNQFKKRTMLTQFFYMNATSDLAKALKCIYKEFPEHFVWHPDKRRETKDTISETEIIVSDEDVASINQLNTKQKLAFDIITAYVYNNQKASFFLDGPGGTSKTFLYKALLADIRSKGFIALATASSGVAASILLGGQTAHSCFKIPISMDMSNMYSVSKVH
ncbi:sister chromatid cohesion protein PDS5 homolog A-B-like [Coffea eugenioides]|uniref:sister chromatid cohesion protein PDS5 homolog A-B-like n=1 Tax=Coffea eugenioides TaxID=49369 RepID=UPI000F6050A7|nr:sister chromatid cohesion protein PDS5 homolog A-B-like [Coffea eugenioides]